MHGSLERILHGDNLTHTFGYREITFKDYYVMYYRIAKMFMDALFRSHQMLMYNLISCQSYWRSPTVMLVVRINILLENLVQTVQGNWIKSLTSICPTKY